MENYFVDYKGKSLARAESLMRVVNEALSTFQFNKKSDAPEIAPTGSFLLRAAVHSSPIGGNGLEPMHGHADIVATIPDTVCSLDDVHTGKYLEIRKAFIAAMESHLKKALYANEDGSDGMMMPSGVEESDQASLGDVAAINIEQRSFQHSSCKKSIDVSIAVRGAARGRGIQTVRVHARPAKISADIASKKAISKHSVYSHLVMEDYLMPEAMQKFHAVVSQSANILRAALVLRAWISHAGLSGFRGGLSGFVVDAMLLRLLEEGIVATTMSEENIVRAVWVQLSRSYFSTETATNLPIAGQNINVLFRSQPRFLNEHVRAAAESAIRFASPAELFHKSTHLPHPLRFDVSLRIAGLPAIDSTACTTTAVMKDKWSIDHLQSAEEHITQLIEKALGERISCVLVTLSEDGTVATVGFKVAKESDARNRLVRGPSIENEEAVTDFNDFWGADHVTTRQFADGGINRCILFDNTEIPAAAVFPVADVLVEILTFAIRKHVEPSATVTSVLGELRGFLEDNCGGKWVDAAALSEHKLRAATKELNEAIENLGPSALPCKVTAFDTISAASRSTEVFGVRPHISLQNSTDEMSPCTTSASTMEPIHCVLNIDDKHKIPDNLEAISKMKGALCAQLCKAMQQVGYASFCTSSSVDVILSGFLFRIYIAHFREVSLLNALQRNAEAEVVERKLFWATRHAAFIASLSNGHPSFGFATRLAKRWIGAMLLSDFVLPETVELLVAYVYQMAEQRGSAPLSPQAGFFGFLELVSRFNWAENSLVFPFVEDAHLANKKRTETAAMWIVAPYATEGVSPFTKPTPRPMIMSRFVALAKSSYAALLLGVTTADVEVHAKTVSGAFRVDMSEFDFSLSFARELVLQPTRCINVTDAAGSMALRRMWHLDELKDHERQRYVHQLAELDPAGQCVRTLRAHTRDTCMVFHDAVAPDVVGVALLGSSSTPKQRNQIITTIQQALPGGFTNLPELEKIEVKEKKPKKQQQQQAPQTPKQQKKVSADVEGDEAKEQRGSKKKAQQTPQSGKKRKAEEEVAAPSVQKTPKGNKPANNGNSAKKDTLAKQTPAKQTPAKQQAPASPAADASSKKKKRLEASTPVSKKNASAATPSTSAKKSGKKKA